jgi:hypothetical protein
MNLTVEEAQQYFPGLSVLDVSEVGMNRYTISFSNGSSVIVNCNSNGAIVFAQWE